MKSLQKQQLPYHFQRIEITDFQYTDQHIIFYAKPVGKTVRCPDCKVISTSLHSYYQRTWRDLPIAGIPVKWKIKARRFRCENENCHRKTFTERFDHIITPNGQRTKRFTNQLRHISYSCSAEAGAKLAKKLGLPTSGDTLLRIIRASPSGYIPPGTIVGIDDWSFKRGLRFGTIIIDLEKRRPIELLSDRKSKSVEVWLKQHPNIRIVTRDRSREYRNGIDIGAPQARQVADRWHIIKNYQEAVEKQLRMHSNALNKANLQWKSAGKDENPQRESTNHSYRLDLFREVKRLSKEGISQRNIATMTGMSRSTVRRYISRNDFPDWKNRLPKVTNITPYMQYLKQQWDGGCHNARILHERLEEQGYPGTYASVRRYVRLLFRENQETSIKPFAYRFKSPKQVAFLLIKRADKFKTDESKFLETLFAVEPVIRDMHLISQKFIRMFRSHDVTILNPWIVMVSESDFQYLKSFANGLKKDYRAVRASLELFWSNGQTEGQVNRLKFIKRQMYGRAKFDLLRQKVLYPS